MTLQHKLEKVENVIFDTLMESTLRISKLLDVDVFFLVEGRNNQRRYGGSQKLCQFFEGNGIILSDNDAQVEVNGPDSSLREILPTKLKRKAPPELATLAKIPRVLLSYCDDENAHSKFSLPINKSCDGEEEYADYEGEGHQSPLLMYADEHEQENYQQPNSLISGASQLGRDILETYEEDFERASSLDVNTGEGNDDYDDEGRSHDEDFVYGSDKSESSNEDWKDSKPKSRSTKSSKDEKSRSSHQKKNAMNTNKTKSRTKRSTVRKTVRFSTCSDDESDGAIKSPPRTKKTKTSVSDERSFVCKTCEAAFKRAYHLVRHRRNVHAIYEEDVDWD